MRLQRGGDTRRLILILTFSFIISGILLLPFCNALFKCGCALLWAGATELCNINQVGVPHCPWCVKRNLVWVTLPFLAVFAGQGVAIYQAQKRWTSSPSILFLVGLIVFGVLGTINGFVFKLVDGYPHFFF